MGVEFANVDNRPLKRCFAVTPGTIFLHSSYDKVRVCLHLALLVRKLCGVLVGTGKGIENIYQDVHVLQRVAIIFKKNVHKGHINKFFDQGVKFPGEKHNFLQPMSQNLQA